jgi:hypothetical protein
MHPITLGDEMTFDEKRLRRDSTSSEVRDHEYTVVHGGRGNRRIVGVRRGARTGLCHGEICVDGTDRSSDPHPHDSKAEAARDVDRILFALPESSQWWAKVPTVPAVVTFGRRRSTGKRAEALATGEIIAMGDRSEAGRSAGTDSW